MTPLSDPTDGRVLDSSLITGRDPANSLQPHNLRGAGAAVRKFQSRNGLSAEPCGPSFWGLRSRAGHMGQLWGSNKTQMGY